MNIARLRPAQEIEKALISMLAVESLTGFVPKRRGEGEYRLSAELWSQGQIVVRSLTCDCDVEWVAQVPYAYHDTVALIIQRAASRGKPVDN